MHLVLSFALLAASGFGAARAPEVYKCTTPAGTIAFQDVPCASGQTETTVHIKAAPPAPPPDESGDGAGDQYAPPVAPAPTAGAPPAPRSEPPTMYLCTRPEDGTQYLSNDGAPPTRMVPGGVLGMPGKSLATTYGKGGVGVSAPGVRKTPISTAPQDSVATDYVAVQDQCEPATREATCAYLQDQYDKIHAKLRRAFKDEQAVLQPQADALEAQLDGC